MRKGKPIKDFFMKHPWTSAAIIGLVVSLILIMSYLFGIKGDMTDFGVGYKAGSRYLAGETLYRAADGHLQFKYAPAAAVFYAAFSVLPWEAAKILWFCVMISCLAAILIALCRSAGLRRDSAWKTAGLTVLVLLKYLGREFELGQVNLLILLLMVLMVGDWRRGKNGRAGVFWGLSLLFKTYAAIFLPYFVLRRKGRTAAAGMGTLLAGLLLPAFRYGGAGNRIVLGEWMSTLGASTPGLLKVGDNASIFAFLSKNLRLPSEAATFLFGGLLVAVMAGFLLWMIIRGGQSESVRPEILEAAALMMMVPMLSPLGWNYNYLYGLPAVFLLIVFFDRFKPGEKVLLAADFVIIGVTVREVLGKSVFRFYTIRALVVPCFLILFAMLVCLRRRRIA